MPGTVLPAGRVTPRRPAVRRAARLAGATGLAVLTAAGLAGCYGPASAGTAITLNTAYVTLPAGGQAVAYLEIRNNGGADRLLGARTSVGGQVRLRDPVRPGGTAMHTIASFAIPAHSTVRMNPAGLHLLITGAGPMRGGKDITLILRFAHAGPVSVPAQVTNPQTGGSSYFLN